MSEPPPVEPSGWRKPTPRDRWFGPIGVIILGLFVVALAIFTLYLMFGPSK